MPKASPAITNFNSGELSPLLAGRVDLKYWSISCRKIRNFIPTPQGPVRRRPGTRFVNEVKSSSVRGWLTSFAFNTSQSYVLEWGNQTIRFYTNRGRVESPPGTPVEVTTPYTSSDLTDSNGRIRLRYVQSGDVQYICHPNHRTKKLTRTGASSFTISDFEPVGGPFNDIDPSQTITVYASANTGSGITLTASSAIFQAGHVGSLFLLEQKNVDSIKMWEAGKTITAGDVRRSDGKNYKALNAATTGSIRPVHTFGAKYDGDNGVQWDFLDPGYGWCKITAIGGGGTTATADVISRIPDGAVGAGNATTRWAFGAWNSIDGWPENVVFFKERLIFSRGRKIWGSVAGDYENFSARDDGGLVTADMAFTIELGTANPIEWMSPSDVALLVGTGNEEFAIFNISVSEPFGPGNIAARWQSGYGSTAVPVVKIGEGTIFVQRDGRKVRDMVMAESINERWVSRDITILAEHITKSGILQMTYQQDPDSVLWAVMGDGRLAGFTIYREQEVRGWHNHRIGGNSDASDLENAIVESVAVTQYKGRDELWMIVRRHINGSTKRYIEFIESVHEEGDDPEDAFHVDSGLTLNNVVNATLTPGVGATVKGTTNVVFTAGSGVFSSGDVGRYIHYRYSTTDVTGKVTWKKSVGKITEYVSATQVKCTIQLPWPNTSMIAANGWRMTVSTISGLSHLEGEKVQIWADGASHPDRTVASGSISLQEPASKVHVGLACPAVIQPMPIEAGSADGTAQGKTQRISRCVIRLHETANVKYGRDENANMDLVLSRSGGIPVDEPPPLFTGDVTVSWPDGYGSPALVTIMQDTPAPCTIVSIMPQINTQDNR